MDTPASLRILASTNNARGDLFTRLVKDLFFALGYDDLRVDVHKSGREIDIQGTHRHEPRRLVAECKAHADKMGGEDLNKFFGVVGRERDKDERIPVAGYFVSLSGFRETGKEQELQTSEQKRNILLDGGQVIDELINSRILIKRETAVERSGGCRAHANLESADVDGTELLGHELGYLWAVFYSRRKQRTHFALIHADGTPLAEPVAQSVIEADRECDGSLNTLTFLSPPLPNPNRMQLVNSSVERYRRWLLTECGDVQLDGLPADTDLTQTRMELERLFVPLKVVAGTMIIRVGDFLAQQPRFSLLAKPGGGKTTLLKRLAVAYATPERRSKTDDGLPERDWLPLLLRCRELRDRAHRPIRELLEDLPMHAAMNGEEAASFRGHIDGSLRSGQALLLIDGLDEISDEGARKTFARHLRCFLAMFPHVALVVTSREAGYRQVAGVIASACEQARLAPFDEADMRRLCERWHVEVVGDTDKVRLEASQLASTIWKSERIRSLAENPLMLTTLLVVKRNVGELPSRRVKLYRAAVDVLIRTWNVEGYTPLDEDETLAQLSYVACAMMNEGQQRVSGPKLLKLLRLARTELQAELQFAAISPAQFVERIEYRSSLLMQVGHEQIDGEMQSIYEFRHLTFQEYLAARGFVEERYPGRDEGRNIGELLEAHFEEERWREVIPLAAILAGRRAESLILKLTTACANRTREHSYPSREDVVDPRVAVLRQCLLDEVQVTQPALRDALRQLARHSAEERLEGSVINLRRGKFGELFQEVVEKAYFGGETGWENYFAAMKDLALVSTSRDGNLEVLDDAVETLMQLLGGGNRVGQACAAFAYDWLAQFIYRDPTRLGAVQPSKFRPLRDAVGDLLALSDPPVAYAAAWALLWAGASRVPDTPPEPRIIVSLFRWWRDAVSTELQAVAAGALSTQPLFARDCFAAGTWGDCDTWLQQSTNGSDPVSSGALVIAWYRRGPLDDSELAERLGNRGRHHSFRQNARTMLATLGDQGRSVLQNWDRSQVTTGIRDRGQRDEFR